MGQKTYEPMGKEEKARLVAIGEAKFSKYIVGHEDYTEQRKRDILGNLQ